MPPKPAVAHDHDMVAGLRRRDDRVDQRAEIGVRMHALTERLEPRRGVPVNIGGVAEHQVGGGKTVGERVFHRAALHRRRPRLEHGEDPCPVYVPPQAVQRCREWRLGDGRNRRIP